MTPTQTSSSSREASTPPKRGRSATCRWLGSYHTPLAARELLRALGRALRVVNGGLGMVVVIGGGDCGFRLGQSDRLSGIRVEAVPPPLRRSLWVCHDSQGDHCGDFSQEVSVALR